MVGWVGAKRAGSSSTEPSVGTLTLSLKSSPVAPSFSCIHIGSLLNKGHEVELVTSPSTLLPSLRRHFKDHAFGGFSQNLENVPPLEKCLERKCGKNRDPGVLQ